MKTLLETILAGALGAVGCVVYIALWGIGIIFALWLGLTVLNWIF